MNNKKILVAFRSDTMRKLLVKFFQQQGYETCEASEGADVLKMIYTERPDCVVIYFEFPVVSGYNVSRIIKNSKDFRRTSVIICAEENTSVYQFWADNSLSDRLFVLTDSNLPELLTHVEDSMKKFEVKESSAVIKETLPEPTNEKLLELSIAAFEQDLYNLYIIQRAYKEGITFDLNKLTEEILTTLSGVFTYDAIGIIINSSPIIEHYNVASYIPSEDFEDFKNVCRNDFAQKMQMSKKISWQKTAYTKTSRQIQNASYNDLKSYEVFPSANDSDSPMTIHIGSCSSDTLNGRTRDRIEYLFRIYSKLMNQAVEYNRSIFAEKKMRNAFSHFVPPKLIEEIIAEDTASVASVNEKRNIAVLITDIRNFTTISEMNEPEKVVEFLNGYFSKMGRIIKKYGGTIDKFMGDAIMALFGAPESYPDNGNRAANAALEMHEAIKSIEMNLNIPNNYKFSIGTGIHYGPTIVGSIGSEEKKEYTVIGDNVNIASRVEGLTKLYGTPIIITDSVKKDLTGGQKTRHLDNVKVKGKSIPVAIYELILPDKKETHSFTENYQKGMNQYTIGNFEIAKQYFRKSYKENPQDKASLIMYNRCLKFANDRPDDWDGAVKLTTK